MACNDNVVKNIANEVTRECQAKSCSVDTDFVVYLIQLLLLNPKYGKLFEKTLKRKNLEFFVNECVSMLTSGETSTKTLRMQHILQSNYDKLQILINKHLDNIDNCLDPLVSEILEEDPEPENEAEMKKLFRKISIYIILASGLGNPSVIITLKEGMAALESVLSLAELRVFLTLPRGEKLSQLLELLAIVSGVRLFNRDCKKGGDNIPDLPFELVDATKACLASLANSLVTVMQRVNSLTSAIEDSIKIEEETGNVIVNVPANSDLTQEDYTQIFAFLVFNRQYEVFTRRLLTDTQTMSHNAALYCERLQAALAETHAALKYKAAVPVNTVFPLFVKLWQVWRAMQNEMYLVSTVNRLTSTLAAIQEQLKIPYHLLDQMLRDKAIVSDQERMRSKPTLEDRISLMYLKNYVASDDGSSGLLARGDSRHIQYLGFCALCLCVGALVPCNMKLGTIKHNLCRYGFCSVNMASRFSKDPQRYINEVLEYARNNPHVINLLSLADDVYSVRDVDELVVRYVPKIKVSDQDAQTETHPVEGYIEKNYCWNLWVWKQRACQWANIVNCQTHSTQTDYSHMRSEIHCQTTEPRDKCQQTKRDCGVNVNRPRRFFYGLRGHLGDGQHSMDLTERIDTAENLKPRVFTTCNWPCIEPPSRDSEESGPNVPESKQDTAQDEDSETEHVERFNSNDDQNTDTSDQKSVRFGSQT